jgi:N-acetylglucosaminyldiphosphoundecaprenol N-acetyl-beta-D-mannosaminyltransferase
MEWWWLNKRIRVLNCWIDDLNMEETLREIEDIISNRRLVQHVAINAGKVVMMHKDRKLMDIINSCQMVQADGQSIVWASRILGEPLQERVAGIDLMEKLVQLADQKGYRVFFFGAREEVVSRVVSIYRQRYKNLQVAGYRNGYFEDRDSPGIVAEIRKSHPDILFIAFESPRKEYWVSRYLSVLNVPFCMGVGGSFDVIAGVTRRAPNWIQRMGLEWFYRFMQEPRRMWRRYLVGNSIFLWLLVREKIRLYRSLQF